MILPAVLVKVYTVITFIFIADECWNMNHPRPFPKQEYYIMQWEEDDFIKMKDGSYRLRLQRKTDSDLKKHARQKALD